MKKKKAVLNNGYLIYSDDNNILIELLLSNHNINWNLFSNDEYFYSEDCEEYLVNVNHTDKKIILTKIKV